jgi:hypothetical protein
MILAHYFLLYLLFVTFIHTIQSYILSSLIICRGLSSLYLHHFGAQQEKPPWGAGLKIELKPALQQANALPTELRCTLLSYAAPA